jgi:hypothetical protein
MFDSIDDLTLQNHDRTEISRIKTSFVKYNTEDCYVEITFLKYNDKNDEYFCPISFTLWWLNYSILKLIL